MNAPLPRLALLAGCLLAAFPVTAQQPVLSYVLSVDTNDYSTMQVAVRLRNLPPIFHLAMARHFFWTDNAPCMTGDPWTLTVTSPWPG